MKISMLRRHVEIHSRKLKQDYVDILHMEVCHCSNAVCVLYTHALWMLAASIELVKLLLLAAGCCDYWCWICNPTLLRCRCNVSAETYLVRMSAGLLFVWILMMRTMSSATSCCMNKCRSSMCFALRDVPIRVAMLLPLDESVRIRMLIFLMLVSSSQSPLRCNASVAPVLIAYSSASALDSAIVACVLLP